MLLSITVTVYFQLAAITCISNKKMSLRRMIDFKNSTEDWVFTTAYTDDVNQCLNVFLTKLDQDIHCFHEKPSGICFEWDKNVMTGDNRIKGELIKLA